MTQDSKINEITIELDVPVPMRDGTMLRADIYRPAAEGIYPVLLSRSPYDKSNLMAGVANFKTMVRAGYVFINQDTRGRLASAGEWLPGKYESEDGNDTVQWAASLHNSNGADGLV